METAKPKTEFAPAARSGPDALKAQSGAVEHGNLFTGIVAAMPDLLLVLNENRQIIYANKHALKFLRTNSLESLLGMRTGEAFKCANSDCPGGCGTSRKCSACGSILAILASQHGEQSSKECRLLTKVDGKMDALDLKVTAAPLAVEGHKFTAFYVSDISHEKRRRALEHIFFHDVLNTAGTLKGFSDVMTEEADPQALRGFGGKISRISQRLVEEIQAQRELLKAESGELLPEYRPVSARELLARIAELYKAHEAAKDRVIHLLPGPEITVNTDETLLSRVIGNILKNALEASAEGETVSLWIAERDACAVFSVHNAAVMPNDVKLQVFNRSFSTKGDDRGLGTYSIKLLTERYLNGKVHFTSEEGLGTVFTVKLPLQAQPERS